MHCRKLVKRVPKRKENKIPGPPVGYTDLLDYEITEKLKSEQAEYKAGTKKRYFPLRPSAAGYCSRRLAYELMEYYGYAEYPREVREPNVYRLLELGHSVEYSSLRQFQLVTLVRPTYKQQVLTCFALDEPEDDGSTKLIEGSCDACFISDKYKCIMDVKSVKDGFSKAYATRWTDNLAKFSGMETLEKISETAFYADDVEAFLAELGMDDFLVENIIQLNLYACTDFMRERGIDHAFIYKYNKNDSRHYELRFRPSLDLAKSIEEKFDLINNCVKNQEPEKVPKMFSLGTMHCSFCPFSKKCWPETDAKKEWFKTFPKKKWPIDSRRCNQHTQLEGLFVEYEDRVKAVAELKDLETRIKTVLLDDADKIKKIKLDNGHVYELKYLKSPRPHYDLRRSKL